jgi:hypothetical protein
MIPMLLNQLPVVAAKINVPATGVWIADLDVDLDVTGIVPIGKAILTIGTTLLTGTIDPRATGKVGSKAHVQLIGGGGGWDSHVLALHLHNDVGVISSQVYAQTAAEVGEVVVDSKPTRLGTDYARTSGPASRVLSGVDWFVDFTGVTIVGPRLPVPFNPLNVDILDWDPGERKATLASTDLIVPGTVLLDVRFGTATVRDIEHTFGPDGARATAYCATSDIPPLPGAHIETPGGRLARALGALARESVAPEYLKQHRYRVVIQGGDKRVTLQSVDLLSKVPAFLLDIEVWPGFAGASFLFVPGTEVMVSFNDGDPAQPVIVGFAKTSPPPLEAQIEAVRIALGTVAIDPVAKAPGTQAQIAALTVAVGAVAAWIAAVTALAATPPTSTTFTLFGAAMAAPGATVAGALGGLAAAVAAQVPIATSTKVFSD